MNKINAKWYVYVVVDPKYKDGYGWKIYGEKIVQRIVYVGVGCTTINGKARYDRISRYFHSINHSHRNRPIDDWLRSRINKYGVSRMRKCFVKVLENQPNKVAMGAEKYLIDLLGRLDLHKGFLFNLTDGGEGTNGVAQEVRDKISKANKGRGVGSSNPNYKNRHLYSGKNNPFYGKRHLKETKAKMRRNYIVFDLLNKLEYKINGLTHFCKQNKIVLKSIYGCINKRLYRNRWVFVGGLKNKEYIISEALKAGIHKLGIDLNAIEFKSVIND